MCGRASLCALSPDDIVLELRAAHPGWTEIELLRAAQAKSDALVDAALAAGAPVMVETVLSSSKFERRVMDAAGFGFRFGFVYVTVASADVNAARVRNRVERGGHDVPTDLVRSRRERSHAAMTWFAARADVGLLFENTSTAPALLAEKRPGEQAWHVFDPTRLEFLNLRLPP